MNATARTGNKWLLVNVHHGNEFDCLRINRDVWSKQPIQQLVRDYFVLWYIYVNTATAAPYTSYYTVTDWPHIAVLDPCTGERLAVWEGRKYSEGSALDEALNAFVAAHIAELSARTASETPRVVREEEGSERAVKRRRLADDEEERMMHMAIMASLGGEGHGEGAVEDKTHSNDNTINTHSTNDNNTNNTNTTHNNNNAPPADSASDVTDDEHEEQELIAQHSIPSRNNSTITIHGNTVANTSTVPVATTTTTAPTLQIQLRLPSARTEPLSYSADTPLHVLLRDVAGLLHLSATSAVTLSSNYPRRTFTASQGDQSLRALGIEHKSVLFVDVSE